VKLSLGVTNYSWPGGPAGTAGQLADLARRLDGTGIDTLWVPDHLLQMDPNATIEEPMLEAYTTLGFLAATTSHLRLGTMVTWASIRPPALLVKAVTTLDVLSGGRAWLGIGAGYRGDEAAMMGLPFVASERFSRLEETLELARRMWAGDDAAWQGPHHTFERPLNSPPPVTRPKVLVGGMGERRTLPLVARYADACNLFDVPDGGQTLRHKIAVLARACEAAGREPSEIEVSVSSRLAPGETVEAFIDRCRQFAALGVDHVVLITSGPWPDDELAVILAAVEPAAAATAA
jgi:alkanesulfonate monooxygenase SsuD/methylene tetrahydromethanopterin reductase-like flavin-dependent oxidoreductase (luciferase family)